MIPITPTSEDRNPSGRMQYIDAQLNAFIERLGL